MDPHVSLPREALAELLRKADSPLTPEEYLASVGSMGASMPPLPTGPSKSFRRRAGMALMSKYSILVIAVAGVFLLPLLGFTFENMLIELGLCVVTYFEYRVHRYFREGDPRAPRLGFMNQACFSGGIIIYCLYHAFFAGAPLSADAMTMIETNNVIDQGALKNFVRLFYLGIAIIAGGSQFALAIYYRFAKP